MPYKSKQKQNEYQKIWYAKNRSEYLKDKCCVVCSSTEELEVDHIDPTTKLSHRIWSWSKARRLEELSKCQVLCTTHHHEKTAIQTKVSLPYTHGTRSSYRRKCRCDRCRKWNSEDVAKRRSRRKTKNMRL